MKKLSIEGLRPEGCICDAEGIGCRSGSSKIEVVWRIEDRCPVHGIIPVRSVVVCSRPRAQSALALIDGHVRRLVEVEYITEESPSPFDGPLCGPYNPPRPDLVFHAVDGRRWGIKDPLMESVSRRTRSGVDLIRYRYTSLAVTPATDAEVIEALLDYWSDDFNSGGPVGWVGPRHGQWRLWNGEDSSHPVRHEIIARLKELGYNTPEGWNHG